MAKERPIGIDLGTTFSVVSWVDDDGHTAVIRNTEGDILTPSIVLFTDQEVVVGKEARTATTVRPDLVAEWVKRDMGLPYYSRSIHGRKLQPEVIQACILRKLKADAERELGSVSRVVITVPAYFDEPRRKSTSDAGEMAGLKVLDIVNEPTAAALAFGEARGYLSVDAAPTEEMTVLVYDLGGGTFDATLLHLAPNNIQTLATDGDVQLGGHDWDMRLVEYAADQFQQAYRLDPRKDAVAMNRILASALDAKHTLSARRHALIRVEFADAVMDVPITRELFEEMTADLLERTAYTTRQLLTAARLTWKDVTRLLLVGGSTRMPMVSEMLRKLSGRDPDHTVNPDEAVARGAALYAEYLLAKESGGARGNVKITNVNSHSLGIEGIDPETMRKQNVVLIPRNTPLPAKVKERFCTKTENQRSIVIQVLEGESRQPAECTAIGRTVLRDMPDNLPKNWPIEVTFEYAANGRLAVSAVVPGTHQNAMLEIDRPTGMSNQNIEKWKKPIEKAAGFDAFESMVDDVLGIGDDNKQPPASSFAMNAMPAAGASPTMSVAMDAPPAGKKTWAMDSLSGIGKKPSDGGKKPLEKKRLPSSDGAKGPKRFELLSPINEPSDTPVVFEPMAEGTSNKTLKSAPTPLTMQGLRGAEYNPKQPRKTMTQADQQPNHDETDVPVKRRSVTSMLEDENLGGSSSWLLKLAGHIIFAVLGLSLGYLIISWAKPGLLPKLW